MSWFVDPGTADETLQLDCNRARTIGLKHRRLPVANEPVRMCEVVDAPNLLRAVK
jgi:hypothetical protein